MKILRLALVIAWLAVMAITVRAVAKLGISDGQLFITDFNNPWRAQFNGDFGVHLLLAAAWIAYRERRLPRAMLLALPAALGSVYLLPYVFVATFTAHGRVDALLLGRHAALRADPQPAAST